jgi:outer membrane murein-binding lipoprotein Lpp
VAEFNWAGTPRFNSCIVCGTSEHDSGFIDMIGDTIVMGEQGDIVGVVDLIVCAGCVRQSAGLVGCAAPAEVDELTSQIFSRDQKIENLEKELLDWKERFNKVISFTKDDFDKIAADVGTRSLDPVVSEPK